MCMPHPAANHEYIRGPQALALRPHGHPGPAARGFELVGERMADNTKCSKTLDPCLLHRRPDDQERHVHGFLLTMLAQHAAWMYGCTGASRTKTRWEIGERRPGLQRLAEDTRCSKTEDTCLLHRRP